MPPGLQASDCCCCTLDSITLIGGTIPKNLADALKGCNFENPRGVYYDLNKPGARLVGVPGKKPPVYDIHNVHYVVFCGSCLDDCDFSRYRQGEFIIGSAKPETSGEGYEEGFEIKPDPSLIDTRGSGIAAREFCPKSSGAWKDAKCIVVADAPGTARPVREHVKINLRWNFLIEIKSKKKGTVVGDIWYDVVIQGQVVEGKFFGLDGNQKSAVNEVSETRSETKPC